MRYGIFDQIEVDGRPLAELYRDRLALVRAWRTPGSSGTTSRNIT